MQLLNIRVVETNTPMRARPRRHAEDRRSMNAGRSVLSRKSVDGQEPRTITAQPSAILIRVRKPRVPVLVIHLVLLPFSGFIFSRLSWTFLAPWLCLRLHLGISLIIHQGHRFLLHTD